MENEIIDENRNIIDQFEEFALGLTKAKTIPQANEQINKMLLVVRAFIPKAILDTEEMKSYKLTLNYTENEVTS